MIFRDFPTHGIYDLSIIMEVQVYIPNDLSSSR